MYVAIALKRQECDMMNIWTSEQGEEGNHYVYFSVAHYSFEF